MRKQNVQQSIGPQRLKDPLMKIVLILRHIIKRATSNYNLMVENKNQNILHP